MIHVCKKLLTCYPVQLDYLYIAPLYFTTQIWEKYSAAMYKCGCHLLLHICPALSSGHKHTLRNNNGRYFVTAIISVIIVYQFEKIKSNS